MTAVRLKMMFYEERENNAVAHTKLPKPSYNVIIIIYIFWERFFWQRLVEIEVYPKYDIWSITNDAIYIVFNLNSTYGIFFF